MFFDVALILGYVLGSTALSFWIEYTDKPNRRHGWLLKSLFVSEWYFVALPAVWLVLAAKFGFTQHIYDWLAMIDQQYAPAEDASLFLQLLYRCVNLMMGALTCAFIIGPAVFVKHYAQNARDDKEARLIEARHKK